MSPSTAAFAAAQHPGAGPGGPLRGRGRRCPRRPAGPGATAGTGRRSSAAGSAARPGPSRDEAPGRGRRDPPARSTHRCRRRHPGPARAPRPVTRRRRRRLLGLLARSGPPARVWSPPGCTAAGRPMAARPAPLGLAPRSTGHPSSTGPVPSTSSTAPTSSCPRAGERPGWSPSTTSPPCATPSCAPPTSSPTPTCCGGRSSRRLGPRPLGRGGRRGRSSTSPSPAERVVVVANGVDDGADPPPPEPAGPGPGASATCWPSGPSSPARTCPASWPPSTSWPPDDPDVGLVLAGCRRMGRRGRPHRGRQLPPPGPHPPHRLGRRPGPGRPAAGGHGPGLPVAATRGSGSRPSRPWRVGVPVVGHHGRRRCPRCSATPPTWWPPGDPTPSPTPWAGSSPTRRHRVDLVGRGRERASLYSWDAFADGLSTSTAGGGECARHRSVDSRRCEPWSPVQPASSAATSSPGSGPPATRSSRPTATSASTSSTRPAWTELFAVDPPRGRLPPRRAGRCRGVVVQPGRDLPRQRRGHHERPAGGRPGRRRTGSSP